MRKKISILCLSMALTALSFSLNAEGSCTNEPAGMDGVCYELTPSAPLSGGDYYCDIVLPFEIPDCLGLPTYF